MIEFLSAWSEQIIISIIIVVLIEMIIPNSSNEKYLKIIFGIFIVYIIISPIISKFNNTSTYDVIKNSIYINDMQNLEYTNIDLINGVSKNIYRDNIISSIEDSLAIKGINAKVKDIELKDSLISKITINILDKSGNNKNIKNNNTSSINEIKIEKIQINGDLEKIDTKDDGKSATNKETKENENVEDYIKGYVSENYGIDTNNIKIVRE